MLTDRPKPKEPKQNCIHLENEIKKIKTSLVQHVLPAEKNRYIEIKINEPAKSYEVYPDLPTMFKVVDTRKFTLHIVTTMDI